jgi:hypothetical protein
MIATTRDGQKNSLSYSPRLQESRLLGALDTWGNLWPDTTFDGCSCGKETQMRLNTRPSVGHAKTTAGAFLYNTGGKF